MSEIKTTLNDTRSSAEICRSRGWKVGTRLIGTEGYLTEEIEITAVGEDAILAKLVACNGVPKLRRENCWSLIYRDWREVTQ